MERAKDTMPRQHTKQHLPINQNARKQHNIEDVLAVVIALVVVHAELFSPNEHETFKNI